MATLLVPRYDPDEPWPTLGPSLADFVEERFIFGPGSLQGNPARLDDDKRGWLYSLYEVYPRKHRLAGRRRFKRGSISVRKGLAKTEFMAWVALLELHPESPVRCDGFDAYGDPVGRPVKSPYIPLMSVSVEQVEELAYGAMYYMVTEGPEADLFDASLDRIQRLSPMGRADGKAVALANNPGARDGARTTFQGFDEPHRLYLPRQRAAHETMLGNMSKRPLEDPWSLYVGTAGEPGQQSIAEDVKDESEEMAKGKLTVHETRLWSFYRWADGEHNKLASHDDRVAAVIEATGSPDGEYGPGQFDDIASNWTRKGADKNYLERVWLNRWTRSDEQAFDKQLTLDLHRAEDPFAVVWPKPFVTGGFDGARMRDSTAIVLTDIATGRQKMEALWERQNYHRNPDTGELEPWEIDERQVTDAMERLNAKYDFFRFNADPPHWTETIGSWAGRWEWVEEWWTNRHRVMAQAVRAYAEARHNGEVTYLIDPREFYRQKDGTVETYGEAFTRHLSAAGKNPTNMFDDDGTPLFLLRKLHLTRKFDAAMAAILSWEARLEALRQGAKPPTPRSTIVGRL